MKVTLASIKPTNAAHDLEKPELTPELLAAVMARYSRSAEGLGTILEKIDRTDEEKSVDAIFRFIDYGHKSILDLAPVALFMDGLSIGLIMLLWNLAPIGAGQESSTRYLKFNTHDLASSYDLGIPEHERALWTESMTQCFETYHEAVKLWENYGRTSGAAATKIPESVRIAADQRPYHRMLRNYAFDRARVFLPVAAKSNVCMLMSAGEWVRLLQILKSSPIREAVYLSDMIHSELKLVVGRTLRHAIDKDYWEHWWKDEMETRMYRSKALVTTNRLDAPYKEYLVRTRLDFSKDVLEHHVIRALRNHSNRYAPFGSSLTTLGVEWGWDGIAIAELRDVDRHRSGTRYLDLVPRGFHSAQSELPETELKLREELSTMALTGIQMGRYAREALDKGRHDSLWWMLLGTQVGFSHTTTADKMLYACELRTGVGAHYRYAQHYRELLALWYKKYPGTKGIVLEGSAEPE